jgi:membrane protein implicated in regulation of membrane protease activity
MDWLSFVPVATLVAVVFLWTTLKSYGLAKGKNLADKEDIEQLTRLVEDVKQENALVLEHVRGINQLRLAAV